MAVPDVSSLMQGSHWHPLQSSGRNAAVPTTPGLYRTRVAETGEVIYSG